MCQLTMIHTKSKLVNAVIASVMMPENSLTNKDGSGVYNPACGVRKSEKPAHSLIDLSSAFVDESGEFLIDSRPLMCHVRAASAALSKKLLDADHAHPFVSEHFIFEHNGTLSFKDKTNEDVYKDKDVIDSQIFLTELEKAYTGNVVKDLNTAMALFKGKFAFMIYHKPEDKYYVVRGSSALLHKVDIKVSGNPGTIVNTEYASFISGLVKAKNILRFFGVTLEFDIPKLMDAESVYALDEDKFDLVKVGAIKETPKENFQSGWTGTGVHSTYTGTGATGTTTSPSDTVCSKLYEVCFSNGLSVFDLDEISYAVLGNGIVGLDRIDIRDLLEFVQMLARRNNNKYKSLWKEMLKHSAPASIYKLHPSLKFPYFLTDMNEFKAIFARHQVEMAKIGEAVVNPPEEPM